MKNHKIGYSLLVLVIGGVVYFAGWFHGHYHDFVWPFENSDPASGIADSMHDHGPDEHAHSEPSYGDFLELSETARKNLGLTDEYLKPIALQSYRQTITVPAIVVDRPGRTRLPISASMTGIVTHIHAVSGEAIEPGDLILEMRLTHEDLVTAQKEYLQSLGDRDIEIKEITRIEQVANIGAVSGKTLLDRQYSRDKLDSLLKSLRESLRLHGLSETQIQDIETNRKLLSQMKIFALGPDEHSEDEMGLNTIHLASDDERGEKHTLVLQEIQVQKGQSVNAGETLCTLADYEDLLIEGQAFESEAALISKTKIADWPVSALLGSGADIERIENLSLNWLNNEIDPTTRTFRFFVSLNNDLLDDKRNTSGQRHVTWKYRVGQRLQLGVPEVE